MSWAPKLWARSPTTALDTSWHEPQKSTDRWKRDCWYWCGGPENDDPPPQYDGHRVTGHTNSMNRFCINRHQQGINGIFLDYSARKIWLKELWRLRWARNFSTTALLPNWETEAAWMANFKGP